jgi:DNA-binding GntR family transcriptional regulator
MPDTLTDFVYESLRGQIASGRPTQRPLTLASLAAEYGVSMMPARLAVGRLMDEGLPGLGARRKPAPAPPAPPAPGQRDEAILRDLIRLSFGPESGPLRESHWASQCGTTRTIIRQVFARLAGQGLLEHRPRHGWYVRPFSVKDLRDFLQAREALELKALELARGRLDKTVLRQFLAGNVLPRGGEHPRTDNRLHAYIIERAGNRYINAFFERHGAYYELLFEWEALDRPSELDACRQHQRILRALLADDSDRARRELSHHILHNHELLDAVQFARWSDKVSARLASDRRTARHSNGDDR